uniref:HORMA domain-containing protein n=2 Tax=Schistocephalus solidus TaxID=70667 RepID=A0A0X3PMT2_SCHSO
MYDVYGQLWLPLTSLLVGRFISKPMATQVSVVSNAIDLKGSVEVVADYFYVAINSILYVRGIYPERLFKQVQKFGRTVLIAIDEELDKYLKCIVDQMRVWLQKGSLKRLVLAVKCSKTDEVLERWQFNVIREDNSNEKNLAPKTTDQISSELGGIVRQIVTSNAFLPTLSTSCTFDLLVYTDKNTDIPEGWGETGPRFVSNSTEVPLRSFSTRIHKVESIVSYRLL